MMAIRGVRTWMMTAVLAAACVGASAQGPGLSEGFPMHRPPLERMLGPAGGGRWWNNPGVIEKLKLTDDQRKAMDDILLQHREKLVDLHANLEKAEIGLEPLMGADQPNENQILGQIDKVAQARSELEKANARFLLALRAKLSPDQWKQLQAMHAERRGFHTERGPDGPRHRMAPPEGGPSPGAPAPEPPGPQSMALQPPDLAPSLEIPQAGVPGAVE